MTFLADQRVYWLCCIQWWWEILLTGKFWRKSVGNYSDKRSLDELQICTRAPFVPRNLHQFIFVTPTLQSCSTLVSIVRRSLLPIFSYITNSTGTKHRNENNVNDYNGNTSVSVISLIWFNAQNDIFLITWVSFQCTMIYWKPKPLNSALLSPKLEIDEDRHPLSLP